ncbi:MAG: hypothetical protein ACRD0E_08685, partial [Acidimicrobiales bacterium]
MKRRRSWLQDDPDHEAKGAPHRRSGTVPIAAAVLVVVALPVALVAAGGSSKSLADHHGDRHPIVGSGPARDQVLSALSATTDSKNFDFSYSLFSTAATDAA